MSIPSTNILRYDRQPTGTSMCVFQSDWNPQSRRKKWQPRARKCHRMPLWQLLWIASIYSISVCEQVDLESRMSGSVSSILATPHITILLFHCRQSCIIHNHSWLMLIMTKFYQRNLPRPQASLACPGAWFHSICGKGYHIYIARSAAPWNIHQSKTNS